MIVIESPIKARLIGYDKLKLSALKPSLTYTNQAIVYDIKRFKNNFWLQQKLGPEKFEEELKKLESEKTKTLLFEDEDGFWTYTGLAPKVARLFNDQIVNEVKYPESELIPWQKFPFDLRDYQQSAVNALLEARHGAIEYATGAGKTLVLLYLAKELGLNTVVVTPSISIADQIYKLFTTHFGKKYVGKFYKGKKEIKQFTISVAASLIRLEEDEKLYEELSKTDVLLFDESHTVAAQTLSKLCFNLFQSVPYRFFVSGTQLRNDGLELLLEAIVGPIKSKLTVTDLVNQGFLAKPEFYVIRTESPDIRQFKETNDATRHHLFYNSSINKNAAEIANKMAAQGKQVLLLIEEIEQFNRLLPHFKFEAKFVYGAGSNKNVPKQYQIKNVTDVVNAFNDKEFPILVGTSAVSTGTDFTTVDAIIYLMGGQSEIQLRQAIGRGTRKTGDKTKCYFFDFDITNIDSLHRHARVRQSIYKDIAGEINFIGKND